MEQSFAELLTDAFSETSGPSFSDGGLDFENLNFEDGFQEIQTGNCHEKIDESLQQEASGQTAALSHGEASDMSTAENVDKAQSDEEDLQDVGVVSVDKTPEDYTSSEGGSEQEGSVSGEDEEEEEEDVAPGEEPGGLLRSVHCGGDFCDGNKEDRIFAEGQLLAPECAENPQVRNEEQSGSESDEEVSYFKRVPECGGEMKIKGDRSEEVDEREEEKHVDSSGSARDGAEIKQEENVLGCEDVPGKASLEFPEKSAEKLEDLIAEVSREFVEKMTDFSGEEHQEAGESFADYPSDFSSCEYVKDGRGKQESKHQEEDNIPERAVTGVTWAGRAEDSDEEGSECLYSTDLEEDEDKLRNLLVTGDSYNCSADEAKGERSDDDLLECLDLVNNKRLEELHGGSRSDDTADFNINWNLDVLTSQTVLSEDLLTADKEEMQLSDATLCPAEGDSSYSVMQRRDTNVTSASNQGSLDDSFFFSVEREASRITELGQMGDDEYEEERNWEQEQERIKAFNEFYDDSDEETRREGRQIKVQFCTNLLSQVIHYETDSSDRDSLSSSTEGEEDLSSAETSEEIKEPDDASEIKAVCDPPNAPLPETRPVLSNTQNCTRINCLNMLKVTLKMGAVIVTGLLMFWMASDRAGWLSQGSFF